MYSRVRITPNLMSIAFGISGLAQAWDTAHALSAAPKWPSDLLWTVAALTWIVTSVLYLSRHKGGRAMAAELADATFGSFVALIAIEPMMLGVALAEHNRATGVAVFAVALAATVLIGGWLSGNWILSDTGLVQWHPGYFLPTVAGGLIGSVGSSALGYSGLAKAMFGYGVVSWLILGAVLFTRLFTQPMLAVPLRPTLAIMLAPPVVAGVAWFAINGNTPDDLAYAIAGYALLMIIVQVRLIPLYKAVPFGVGWWAFSFSYAATCTDGIRWLAAVDVHAIAAWTALLLALPTVGITVLVIRTVIALMQGTFLPTAPVPDRAGVASTPPQSRATDRARGIYER